MSAADLLDFLDERDLEAARRRLARAASVSPLALEQAVDKEAGFLVSRAIIRRAITEFLETAKLHHARTGKPEI